jgi:ribose transport system permease protein
MVELAKVLAIEEVGGLLSGVIGGLMASWFSIDRRGRHRRRSADALFGVMTLIAVALTTDRGKIGIIK